MVWKIDDPEGNEAGKIVWEIVPYTRGRGLDLGCGPSKAFPHFIGVDNMKATGQFGTVMKPDVVVDDCTRLGLFGSSSMDFVFSSHMLEHIHDYIGALKEWWRLIKPNGYLVLYLPHRDFYPNIGQPGANPDHCWDFSPETIEAAMKEVGFWDMVRNENRNENREYSFFQVYQKRSAKHTYSCKKPKPEKRAAICRYGAFGDLIQASSLFPGLKEQGYHITVYTTPRGVDVIKHDPHVDEVYLQDNDQVPNHLLPDFWSWESKKYDKFINLSESVEGTFLALPGRTNHTWPINLRRKYMNSNYTEFAHDLADVPMPCRQKFYPSQEEKSWAAKERKRIGGDMVFMFCLSGSSVHKVWPHMDGLFARLLMTYENCRIVTVGDEMSQFLEGGWQNEKRVVRMAGKYSIRESLALLDHADMVIGPETGVMNAASMMTMPKIVMLSHSSHENLTKHWVNTIALEPKNTKCFPCHMMHYSFENCNRDEATGTAACQADIDLNQAWSAVETLMKKAA
jgi:ADP-heptose:LPS heptosyltransferase/predicted SAM-dependent methyltransferase